MAPRRCEIEWTSAEVHEGDVTVALNGKVTKAWRERFRGVLALLGSGSGGWGEVRLVHKAIEVEGLRPEAEEDLRHFLESAVGQVNAELPQDDRDERVEPGDRMAILDAEMTATLRGFAEARTS
ncbi:MAG TPA: hypothetical protein VMB05_06465 [Solirubrobacteraceae bacterium]|nr:hypothetical protein [Solirubrobacteraceae bacterium]